MHAAIIQIKGVHTYLTPKAPAVAGICLAGT
jgi:hypothetical protein